MPSDLSVSSRSGRISETGPAASGGLREESELVGAVSGSHFERMPLRSRDSDYNKIVFLRNFNRKLDRTGVDKVKSKGSFKYSLNY